MMVKCFEILQVLKMTEKVKAVTGIDNLTKRHIAIEEDKLTKVSGIELESLIVL